MDVVDQFLTNLAWVILNPLIKLMFAAAAIYFLWGVFTFVKGSDSESDRKKGLQHIIWSIFGFVVMMGVYGILQLVTGSFLP